MVRLFAPALAFSALALYSRAASANELPSHLEVSRSADAASCPDALQLAAAVAETVGHAALDTSDAPHGGRFAVVFARLETGFVATVQREEPRPVARTLADTRGSCGALAGAVVVALALMLDVVDAPPPPVDLSPSTVQEPVEPFRRPRSIPDRPFTRVWYGWQILAVDAAAAATAGTSLAPSLSSGATTTLAAAGLITYALVPPFVHGAHKRWGMFGASIGLRLGAVTMLSVLGAVVGNGVASAPSGNCNMIDCSRPAATDWNLTGAVLGGVVGAIVATSIDSALFARERVWVEPSPASSTAFSWRPSVSPVAHGVTAGVAGLF